MSIFDDFKDLADDVEITIGDKTVKFGDLRGVQAERDRIAAERDAAATERDRYRGDYEKLGNSVAALLGTADRAATKDIQEPPLNPKQSIIEAMKSIVGGEDPSEALFQDKLFGRALTKVEERAVERAMAENKKLAAAVDTLKEEMTKGFNGLANATVYQQDAMWYGDNKADIPKGQDDKRITLKQLQDYADQNGIYQQGTRIRDLDRVLDIITAPTRREAEIVQVKKQAYEEGMQAARASAGKVIPLMSERNGGAMQGNKEYSTAGKSARQIVQERIAQGMQELSEDAG